MAEETSIFNEAFLKISYLIFTALLMASFVSADYYYNSDSSSLDGWGDLPEFESQEEILTGFVAPFLFVFILMQFSLKNVLEFTFAGNESEDNVNREATVMAAAITLMVVASPYWLWIQTMAASLGVIAAGAIVLVFLFLIYKFLRG